jgi:hypothetical protein
VGLLCRLVEFVPDLPVHSKAVSQSSLVHHRGWRIASPEGQQTYRLILPRWAISLTKKHGVVFGNRERHPPQQAVGITASTPSKHLVKRARRSAHRARSGPKTAETATTATITTRVFAIFSTDDVDAHRQRKAFEKDPLSVC